ncbi:unnamed protein product [Mesocestoides corti]|uniref:Coatomer subunit zeta n=1 Tax=Mesocestoides corti TaxID=53468 RepID=A0A3P6H9H8_MESCO|nr:unnamed protein product [Mesocestoides corti]
MDFEKKLFSKTNKSPYAEITLFEGTTCVHRTTSDIYFYIIGDVNENEVLHYLVCMIRFHKSSEITWKRRFCWTIWSLIIMENDASVIASKVGIKPEEMSLSEQTVTQAMLAAREQIKMALLR